MAVSKLEVFKTGLTPDKNAKIDNIDAYLDNPLYSEKTYSNDTYQYQRIVLDTIMKITAKQEDYNGMAVGNYIRLTQGGEKFYYFIMGVTWTGMESCALQCSLDTVNSFVDKLQFTDKTLVMREHADRYSKERGTASFTEYYFARKLPKGQDIIYKLQDNSFIGANIERFAYRIVVSTGSAYVASCKMTNFDARNGILELTANIGVLGDDPRATSTGTIFFDVEYYGSIKRIIDFVNEGITPQLYGEDIGEVKEKVDGDENWYLIYNAKKLKDNEGKVLTEQPIDTLLCKDVGFTASISDEIEDIYDITADTPNLTDGHYYMIDSFNGTATKARGVEWWGNPYDYWAGSYEKVTVYDPVTGYRIDFANREDKHTNQTVFFQFKDGQFNLYTVKFIVRSHFSETLYNTLIQKNGTYPSLKLKSRGRVNIFENIKKPTESKVDCDIYYEYAKSISHALQSPTVKTNVYIHGVEQIDRTQTTLLKIVKLPYCPLSYEIGQDGVYRFKKNVLASLSEENGINANLIQIDDNIKLGKTLDTDIENPLAIVGEPVLIKPNVDEVKNIKYETKLYHSEFYKPTFIYDSFCYSFNLEKLSHKGTCKDTLQVDYKPSRMFNSATLYTFNEYNTTGKDVYGYNNILYTNRNNELPIFNSAYMNYIRTGYNYDIKAKDASIQQAKLGAITTGVNAGVLVGLVGAVGTYGKSLTSSENAKIEEGEKVFQKLKANGAFPDLASDRAKLLARRLSSPASVATTMAGLHGVNSIVSNIREITMAQENGDNKINASLDNAQNAGVSVSACDSLDLLDDYSNNKAKLKLYKASEKMRQTLFDIFYYTGYNYGVQKIPNTYSRYWFNYIQCDPVFEGRNLATYNDFITDIKERYKAGVTVYHYHVGNKRPYDIEQTRENWEVALI